MRLLILVLFVAAPAVAAADSRGVIRVGVTPIALTSDADTPLFGARVGEVVDAYNAAADAYDDAHGGAMTTAPIGAGDLAVRATLVTITPAVELGDPNIHVRLEAVLALGDDLRAYGVGFYPFQLAARVRKGSPVTAYITAGGRACWLDRPSTADELGALFTARAAVGVRVRERFTLEAGYAYVLGGLLDRGRLKTMADYDPRGAAPPPMPAAAVAGGEQRGVVEVSLGVAF